MRVSAMTERPASWDIEIDWHLTNRCNFHCEYCHPQIRHVLNRKHLNEPTPELVVRRVDEIGRPCLVHMSGGEPFMFPGFVSLCGGLTRHNFISINTNLACSSEIAEFVERVNPDHVVKVVAAVHLPERERLSLELRDYADSYLRLRNAGFDVVALYVLHPPLLGRFNKDLNKLRSLGVDHIRSKVFKGVHAGKRYPDSYTAAERSAILAGSGEYLFNKPYMDGSDSFTGRPCWAGVTSFKVTVTGDVHRCATVNTNYGNLYDGTFEPAKEPTPCPARRVKVLSQCASYLVDPPFAPAR